MRRLSYTTSMRRFSYTTAGVLLGMLFIAGCRPHNPCVDALSSDEARTGDGPASIEAVLQTRSGTRGREGVDLACVRMSVLNAEDYADTLAHANFRLYDGKLSIAGLPDGDVDVIFDRTGFFPVKLAGISLDAGPNRLVERVLLYSSREAVTIPGAFGIALKDGAVLEQVSDVFQVIEGARVFPEPGGSYQVEIPVEHGLQKTRERVERLCRKLVWSPAVENARPLVNLTAVYSGI